MNTHNVNYVEECGRAIVVEFTPDAGKISVKTSYSNSDDMPQEITISGFSNHSLKLRSGDIGYMMHCSDGKIAETIIELVTKYGT
jgi:hypothetical protein